MSHTDSPEDIEAFMTDCERRMVLLCSEKRTKGYARLSEEMGLSYQEAQRVGRDLQGTGIVNIRLLAPGFNGSGIFLNEVGVQIKQLLEEKKWVECD